MKIAFYFLLLALSVVSCKKDDSLVLYTPPSPPGPVVGKTFNAQELLCFKQLVLGGQAPDGMVKKLMGKEVLVYVADTAYAHMNMELDSIIRGVNALTDSNLVLKRTNDKSSATIKLYLTNRQTYLSEEPGARASFENSTYELYGLSYLLWGGDYKISHAGVFVDMYRPDSSRLLDHFLIHHELMHALGFIGHTNMPDFSYSLMYYYMLTPYTTDFSAFDKRMIQLLYNPSIKAGMDENRLNAVLVNL